LAFIYIYMIESLQATILICLVYRIDFPKAACLSSLKNGGKKDFPEILFN